MHTCVEDSLSIIFSLKSSKFGIFFELKNLYSQLNDTKWIEQGIFSQLSKLDQFKT
jgi:hypothetical protein